MADTLVLAALTIDASGAIKGSAQVNQALASSEKALGNFSSQTGRVGRSVSGFTSTLKVLTFGYISLATANRAAAASLAFVREGFTKVLAEEKKYFAATSDVVKVTDEFTKSQDNLQMVLGRTVANSSLYLGIVERVAITMQDMANLIPRLMPALKNAPGGGLGSALAVGMAALDAMKTTEKQVANRAILAQAAAGGAQFGAKRPEAITDPKRLAEINNAAEKLLDEQRQQRFDSEQNRIKSLSEAVEASRRIRETSLEIELDRMAERSKLQKEFNKDMQAELDLRAEMFQEEFNKGMEDYIQSLQRAKEAQEDLINSARFDVMQAAFQALGQTIAESLISGELSGKEAIGRLMEQLATLCFAYAASFLAAGIASTTGWGKVLFPGNTATYFKAAAAFGAAGVVAATAARTLGAGGGAGGGRGGETTSGIGGSSGEGGSERTLNIVVQGSVIGTDPDDLARELLRLQRTATADGG